jgi:aldose sugar dehydrogenase
LKGLNPCSRSITIASAPLAVAALALLAAFPFSASAQVRPAPPPPRKYSLPLDPRVYETFDQKIRVSVVVHGIGRPWSLLPLPNGDFLVGVRPTGQVLAIRDGVLDPAPLTGTPAMHTTFRGR